jgi:hypothetical protein
MHRGNLTDAESLLRYHTVDLSTDGNPYNAIHLALPAVASEFDDIYYGIDRNRDWRRLLR